jgi:hypothetical protein
MAPIESKHDVRRKVRDAQAQVNRERLKRESNNREDMVAFLVAEQKLGAVSVWEAERHAQVRLEAEQRRAEQRLEGARALARMRDRGETVADIAQLGGCSVKLVRRYLKELQSDKRPTTAVGCLDDRRSTIDGVRRSANLLPLPAPDPAACRSRVGETTWIWAYGRSVLSSSGDHRSRVGCRRC